MALDLIGRRTWDVTVKEKNMFSLKRSLKLAAAMLTLIAVLAGCSQGSSTATAASRLVLGASAEPTSMDLHSSDAAAIPQVLLYNVYETLVKIDGYGNIKPLLAASWDISQDRLTYTFLLQPSAHFASERQVKASDVVWSLTRAKEQGTKVQKAQMSVVNTIEATDDLTVKVTLSRPSNAWLFDIAGQAGIVIDSQANTDLSSTPAGSGPYAFSQWRKGASITLVKNAYYWGTPARYDDVEWRYFSDAAALNNAMLSGDLDIVTNVQAPQALGQFNDTSRFQVLEGTTNGEVVLGFNHKNPVLNNLKVRQAINFAINRKGLIDTVWGGRGSLIGSMVPPTDPWYEDLSNSYPYDLEQAKKLMAESGVVSPTLRLRLPTLAYATGAGQYVASQLKEIGITVVTDQLEFPAQWVEHVLVKSDYDLTIVAHVEPRDMVKFANSDYYWHYGNQEFAQLITQADQSSEGDYATTMKQAARILSDDAAADFLFLLPNLIVSKPGITGISKNMTSTSFDLTTVASRG
ncbi:MAG: ABC transporter substrate-binding protein [Propionibacteriaceae bacterium]